MNTHHFTKALLFLISTGLFAQTLIWADFWISPAYARYYDCSNPFDQPPDPNELVWLPYKTFCAEEQTMPSNPSRLLIDDYPDEDLENCAELATARALARATGDCYWEPASDVNTVVILNYPLICNGNPFPSQLHYWASYHLEFYEQDFYSICPGYPTQTIRDTIGAKHFVREPVGPDEIIEEKNLGSPQCGLSAGNPINIATGNKYHRQQDIALPGGLEIVRHYNSKDPANHAFGAGWRGNYSRRIDYIASENPATASLTVTRDDGTLNYWRIINAIPHPPPDAKGRLEAAYDNEQIIGFTYRADGSTETYDHDGKLLSIENDQGELLQFSYVNAQLSSVITLSGRGLEYFYDAGGLIRQISSSGGSNWNYFYDQANNLSTVEYPDGTIKTYHYENPDFPNALTGETDEKGKRTRTWAYDLSGRAILSTFGSAESTVERHTVSYNADGTSTTSSPMQNSIDHSFENTHGISKFNSVSDACGSCSNNNEAVTYDENGNRDIVTDFEGNVTDYDYSGENLLQMVTHAVGTTDQYAISYDWDINLRKPSMITRPGRTTSYTYNSRGQVLTRTDTDTMTMAARTQIYAYFELPSLEALVGKLKNVDGPHTGLSDVTHYEYFTSDHPGGEHLAGDLKAVINPLGHRTDFLEYDGDGRLLKISDANGVITSISYHPRGWRSSTTTDGRTSSFSHDSSGNLHRITQPDGSYINYEYDDFHRLTAIADANNNRIEYSLDAAGNRISEDSYDDTGVLRRHLRRVYDSLNRLEKLIDGNDEETNYDYGINGNLTSMQDANQNVTSFGYDPLDRLNAAIDSAMGETRLQHDDRGNLVSVTDPLGNATRYSFDGLDNQLQLDSPDSGITSYEYDEAGNRIAATDARGIRIAYSHDAINRPTGIIYPDSTLNISFSYDAGTNGKGRLTGMSDGAGTTSYSYDARGNLLNEIRTIGEYQYLTAFAYNPADRLTQITYPSGMVIDFTVDATGQVTAVNRSIDGASELIANHVQYEPFGPVFSFTYGNGLTYSAVFDQEAQVEQLQSGESMDWALNYDPAGNVLAITDSAGSQNDQAFEYDNLHRLKTADGSYGSENFEYDANGNRLRYQSGLTDLVYSYEPQSNRLLSQDNWTHTRDAAGNRTSKLDANGFGQLFTFASHKRLTQLRNRGASGDELIKEYQYDGRGQRVSKSLGAIATHFIYGPSGELLGEYSTEPNGPSQEYVYLNGQVVAAITQKTEILFPPAAEVVLDNGDPGTAMNGSWRTKSNSQDYGTDYLFASKSANRSYRWTATPPGSNYRVYAWWVDRKNQSNNVTYTVRFGSGETDSVSKSQATGGGQWQLLGSYHSTDGQDYVEVSSADNKFVADALRWVEIPEPVTTRIETTNFIHFDHLGTPRQVTSEDQTVVWRWDSTPFGDSTPDDDPDGDSKHFTLNLRFPGQYYDAESGLHYNYFRTYDPVTGRYIESDPIGLKGGLNTFAYAYQNPHNFIDPLGLQVTGEWIRQPRFNVTSFGIDDVDLVIGSGTPWGQLEFFRIFGYVSGYVNIDVRCMNSDECANSTWEIHDRIHVFYEGSTDVGPNAYAAVAGRALGFYGWAIANILATGSSALGGGLELLKAAERKAGPEIALILELGPDTICLASGGK